MSELRLLMVLLEQLDIRLVPRYILSELNPADFFSRLTDRDAWTLSSSVQRSMKRKRKRCSAEAFRSMPSLVHSPK